MGNQFFRRLGFVRGSEIAPDHPQYRPFIVDFALGSNASTAEQRQRRAPALQCVLQAEGNDCTRQQQPPARERRRQHDAAARENRPVHFQGALDVPLLIQFEKAATDLVRMMAVELDTIRRLGPDPLVGGLAGVKRNTLAGLWKHEAP